MRALYEDSSLNGTRRIHGYRTVQEKMKALVLHVQDSAKKSHLFLITGKSRTNSVNITHVESIWLQ